MFSSIENSVESVECVEDVESIESIEHRDSGLAFDSSITALTPLNTIQHRIIGSLVLVEERTLHSSGDAFIKIIAKRIKCGITRRFIGIDAIRCID